MPELKDLLRALFPLLLLGALVLFQVFLRTAGRSRTDPETPLPAEAPGSERIRPPRKTKPRPADQDPGPRPEARVAPDRVRREAPPAMSRAEPVRARAERRTRLRRLLATPAGRRTAVLAHEILRPPPGLERGAGQR